MKLLGLIGGMSFESTLPYYREINQRMARRLGGLHSAELLLYSVDFDRIAAMQRDDRWDEAGTELARCAALLEGAGAKALVLCTNTMHKVAPAIEAAVRIPLLHIADATAAAIRAAGLRRVGLLGTRFTMEQDFTANGSRATASTRSCRPRRNAGRCTASSTRSCARGGSKRTRARSIAT